MKTCFIGLTRPKTKASLFINMNLAIAIVHGDYGGAAIFVAGDVEPWVCTESPEEVMKIISGREMAEK